MFSTFITMDDFHRMTLLVLPLVFGGVLHMVAVKLDILSYLKKPIHQRWFGLNKTWRGFLIMPLATFPGVVVAKYVENLLELNPPLLITHSSYLLALILGTAYCLAELPNSFVKRRMGVKEGLTSERYKIFFILQDQADSAFGCLIAYKLLLPISWTIFWGTILYGIAIKLLINILLYLFKIRKNPF